MAMYEFGFLVQPEIELVHKMDFNTMKSLVTKGFDYRNLISNIDEAHIITPSRIATISIMAARIGLGWGDMYLRLKSVGKLEEI